MKTIVMTGATSFLGRNTMSGLAQEGYKVYAMVRKTSSALAQLPQSNNIHYIYADLEEFDRLCREVDKADVFIHFAWDGSGYAGRSDSSVQNRNIAYSMNALKISERLGCGSFIFSGSQAEYGHIQGRIAEDTVCSPVSAYGKAKLEFSRRAEEFSKVRGIHFVHLRIFSVYGWGDRASSLVSSCIRAFNTGESIRLGNCSQKWNYLYIYDFVNAIKRMMRRDAMEGIYNIAGVDTRPLKEFVEEIYSLSNRTGGYELGRAPANPEGSPALDPELGKIRNLLGWRPEIKFSEGVSQIMREHGFIKAVRN